MLDCSGSDDVSVVHEWRPIPATGLVLVEIPPRPSWDQTPRPSRRVETECTDRANDTLQYPDGPEPRIPLHWPATPLDLSRNEMMVTVVVVVVVVVVLGRHRPTSSVEAILHGQRSHEVIVRRRHRDPKQHQQQLHGGVLSIRGDAEGTGR